MAARGLLEKNDSVMSGYLYYKTKKMGLWHKYWVELHRETSTHPRVLQLFQSKPKTDNGNSTFESVVLNNILELCNKQRTASGHPMFQVVSMKMRYQFYTENKQELDRWVEVIQQELFGLPQVGITYQFMVTVVDNLSAKKYSLVGQYTLKVNDSTIMLYSANGLIPTNFSVPTEQLWRVILAPSLDKDSIYSNYVVLDFTDGGVLMLMSESANDIARIVGHRKRLLSSYKTFDEDIHESHPDTGKQNEMPSKAVGSSNSPTVVSKYRDGSISNRPPQPVPRPLIKLPRQAHSVVLESSSLHTPLNNHKRHSATECDYGQNDVTEDIPKAEYLTIFSDENNHTGDKQLYSYVYKRLQRRSCVMDEDIYYISDEDILEIRRNVKPERNRSIKGSKSMEHLIT